MVVEVGSRALEEGEEGEVVLEESEERTEATRGAREALAHTATSSYR